VSAQSRPAALTGPSADEAGYFKAMLNILGDVAEDKANLLDAQRAMLNILGDMGEDKTYLEDAQRAMLNILSDVAGDKAHLEDTQRAMLNILEDIGAERRERERAEMEVRALNDALEARVRLRTAELEAVIEELEGYSYSMAHDLRVPLRAIDGFSSLLLKRHQDSLDAEGKRLLNVVRDNTRKMGGLIDSTLTFSRLGRVEMAPVDVDMEALAREALEELKPLAEGRSLSVDIEPLPIARGDRAMLCQVWGNLLSNALKFTRPKPAAHIEVGGRTEGAEQIYWVRDNGVGFDMQYADKLFGISQRLHGVEEFEGVGIGLAIVKRVVARHGGRVWAEGKVGEGAMFSFALPAGKPLPSWPMANL